MKMPYPAQTKSWQSAFALCVTIFMGFIFFAHNVRLVLATDDLFWMKGQAPTVFDQYRIVPRLLFTALYATFGSNAIAALAMIFATHASNIILIYLLASQWTESPLAALIAAWIFAINPLTLNTLTWISCFSYILGAWFALASLFAFWDGLKKTDPRPGMLLAVASFSIGLFCSHEILFLPLIYPALGWMKSSNNFKQGGILGCVTLAIAMFVNFAFYNFDRYGIETANLFRLDFLSVLVSSALSFGLSLSFAYFASFFHQFIPILQTCFSEPIRWLLTLCLCTLFLFSFRPSRLWNIRIVFVWIWLALILPYILRFYLMPTTVQYHISYILSGRVFYIPFIGLALIIGLVVDNLFETKIHAKRFAWLWLVLPCVAYINLFILYTAKDFIGLNVSFSPPQAQTIIVSWNPYTSIHSTWLLLFTIIIGLVLLIRSQTSTQLGLGD